MNNRHFVLKGPLQAGCKGSLLARPNHFINLHCKCTRLRTSPYAASKSGADNTSDIPTPNPQHSAPSQRDFPPDPQPHALAPSPKTEDNNNRFPTPLWEIDLLPGDGFTESMRDKWIFAYYRLKEDAKVLGIPDWAIPPLPMEPTKEEIIRARDHLNGMIQSFLSSEL